MRTRIRHTAVLVLGCLLLALTLASCGSSPSEGEIEATLEARLNEERVAEATVEAKALVLAKAMVEATAPPTATPTPPTVREWDVLSPAEAETVVGSTVVVDVRVHMWPLPTVEIDGRGPDSVESEGPRLTAKFVDLPPGIHTLVANDIVGHEVTFVFGTVVPSPTPSPPARTTIEPSLGGVIAIDRAGDPLDGLTIQVPPGAYEQPRPFEISHRPLKPEALPAHLNPMTPVITVDSGGGYSEEVMTLRVPVRLPDVGHLPMGFFYEQETGLLEAIPLTDVKGGVKVYQWGGVKLYHRAPQDLRRDTRCVRAGARRLPEVGWTSGCA